MMKQTLFILFIVCLFYKADAACTTFGWVRSTGSWPSDAFGTADWNAAEPNGLMALEESTCRYLSLPRSNLIPGKTYYWKVTTENSWAVNYGCPGRDGPNCAFTPGPSGTIVFIFDPQQLTLSVYNVPPSSATPAPTRAPTPAPTAGSTPAPTRAPTPAPTRAPTPAPTRAPTPAPTQGPAGPNVKQVFAHFMLGNTYWYTPALFERDMNSAKSLGIDAFALNMGNDWTWDKVGPAYAAAQATGFKCFLSFDMSTPNSVSSIISAIRTVSGYPAQYKYSNKVFVSTFGGADKPMGYPSVNAAWAAIKSTLAGEGISIYLVPNFPVNAYTIFNDFSSIDGAFSWAAWPNPTDFANALTPEDNIFMSSANSAQKTYMAPWSPWFYTHLSYKNYLYHCDSLWYDRWVELLAIRPHMIEIITWNDWGEASYIGEIDTDERDLPSGSKDYVYGFPHTAWLDTLPYFIQYYKTGVAPSISTDTVVYWYRPFLKSATASADPLGPPKVANKDTSHSSLSPAQVLADKIFVVTILRSAGTIRVTSGGTTTSHNVPAGHNILSTTIYSGQQTVTLLRNSATLCTSTGAVSVGTNPTKYNFNAYVNSCKYT